MTLLHVKDIVKSDIIIRKVNAYKIEIIVYFNMNKVTYVKVVTFN